MGRRAGSCAPGRAGNARVAAFGGDAEAGEAVSVGGEPVVAAVLQPEQRRHTAERRDEPPPRQLGQHPVDRCGGAIAATPLVDDPDGPVDRGAGEPQTGDQLGGLVGEGQHTAGAVASAYPRDAPRSDASPTIEQQQQPSVAQEHTHGGAHSPLTPVRRCDQGRGPAFRPQAGRLVRQAGGYGVTARPATLGLQAGLNAYLDSTNTQVGNMVVTVPTDGFYFLPAPAAGTYTVKWLDTGSNVKATSQPQTIAQSEYRELDFSNLNPADPVVYGFVTDAQGHGVAGGRVAITNVGGHQVGTATTTASGPYAFRFSAPGQYTVQIAVPAGYTTGRSSVSVSLRQFQEFRTDFSLRRG
jgi:hypothetical protein